jgi:tetratricopeptide (TPR) repeat protein
MDIIVTAVLLLMLVAVIGLGPLARSACSEESSNHLREAAPYLLVWLTALAVRIVYLWQLRHAPVFTMLLGDAAGYDAWARQIANGSWLGKEVFYQAPLYPYFLGGLYTVLGNNLLWVRLVQAIVGACSCTLLALAGRNFFSNKTGLLAGAILAIYPTAIFFDCSIQKSVLDLLFMCALLATLAKLRTPTPARWSAVAGGLLGLLALTRENALILLPIIVTWLLLACGAESWKGRVRWVGLFLVGLAAALLPVALRNLVVGGEFHLTTSQFGPNIYIGNGEKATGIYQSLVPGRGSAEFERDDATKLAEQATGQKLSPRGVSRYWTGRTLAEIRASPTRWLRLMGRKCLLVWNVSEVGDSEDQYTYGDWSPLLRVLNRWLHFGTLCPLALLGVCLTWSQRRRLWLLYAIAIGYGGSVALFYVFSRYRFPIVPILALFSAAGLTNLPMELRGKQWKVIGTGIAIAGLAAVLINRAMVPEGRIRAATHHNIGFKLEAQRQPELALVHYAEAAKLAPDDADVQVRLGVLLVRQGRLTDAITHYQRAVQARPDFAEAQYDLGNALVESGRFPEAIKCYEEAVRIKPDYAEAHASLGVALTQTGKRDEAVNHLEEALHINPDLAEAHNSLGIALASMGKLDSAIAHFEQALRIKPDFAGAHYNLGNALVLAGKVQDAIKHYERAVQINPDLTQAERQLRLLRGS